MPGWLAGGAVALAVPVHSDWRRRRSVQPPKDSDSGPDEAAESSRAGAEDRTGPSRAERRAEPRRDRAKLGSSLGAELKATPSDLRRADQGL